MNRRKFLVNGLLTGAGTAGLLSASAGQTASAGHSLPLASETPSLASKTPSPAGNTAQSVFTTGGPLEPALAGVFQTASHADPYGNGISHNPATVTFSGPNSGSTVQNVTYYSHDSPQIRQFAGRLKRYGGYINGSGSTGSTSYISGLYEGGSTALEFMYDGVNIDYIIFANGGYVQVFVDGVASGPLIKVANTDGYYLVNVSFPTPAPRRITILTSTQTIGFNISRTDTIWRSARQLGPRMIVLGDSFSEGIGGSTFQGFPQVLGRVLGLEDTWASGSGGTGYLNSGPAGRYTFRQRVTSDVIAYNPQIVVICGGTNDSVNNASDAAALRVEASFLYQQISSELPNCRLYVCGPWRPRSGVGINPGVSNALQAAAASIPGITFIDVSQYFTGTGYTSSPHGDGNSDLYIGYDGEHPSSAGHIYLGTRLAAEIAATQAV